MIFLNIVHKGRIIGAQKGQNNVSGLLEKIKSLLLSCESTYGPLTFGCNRLSGKILVLKLRPKMFSANSGAFANLYYFAMARYLIFLFFKGRWTSIKGTSEPFILTCQDKLSRKSKLLNRFFQKI